MSLWFGQEVQALPRCRITLRCISLLMRQALLDSLKGLPLEKAKRLVIEAGHGFKVYEQGVASILLSKPNLVKLWLESDGVTVAKASAGDPTELDSWKS
jgi:hypothetical protein